MTSGRFHFGLWCCRVIPPPRRHKATGGMAYAKFKRANLYNLIMSTHLKKRHSAHPTGAHRTARNTERPVAIKNNSPLHMTSGRFHFGLWCCRVIPPPRRHKATGGMAYAKFKRANLYNLIMSTHLKKRHSAHPISANVKMIGF